jgi:hypothetical protein
MLLVLVAACQPAPSATLPPPLTLLTESATRIRAASSFEMIIEQTGAPYFILTDLGNVIFRRADAQYLAPNVMQADVRLLAGGGIPANVTVFSQGEEQWFRNEILTANQWVNAQFAPGFNPQALISAETGFQKAVNAMLDLTYVEVVTLESGVRAHHMRATASGEDMLALLAGLIYTSLGTTVDVDVYVEESTLLPVRFVIVQPGTETAEEPEPTTWTVDIFNVNEPLELDPPDDVTLTEAAT